MKVILTEKPSVAKDIAAFVNAKDKQEGFFQGNGYAVTWGFGHLVTLKEPHDYNPLLKKWALQLLPFIPENFELKVVDEKGIKKQFSIIKKLFQNAEEIICATDAGREGELIFRNIQKLTGVSSRPWKRLWLSSLTKEALEKAFFNMKEGSHYNSLFDAARCRSESDWIVGLNATRNYTVRYGKVGQMWSLGRVQTPVLALIVQRDDEIRHFKSEPFWELVTYYRDVLFKMKGERFKKQEEGALLLNKIIDRHLFIDEIQSKKEQEHPPLLFDLTELQREMNKRFSYSAQETLDIAQTLYEQKFITYPRTDSRYLTSDLKEEVTKTIDALKAIKPKEIEGIVSLQFSSRLINDKKVSDHHAIIPTGKISNGLQENQARVFEAIVIRLISSFYPSCIKDVTTITASCEKVNFQAKGIRIVNPGWTLLYPKKEKEDDENQELPTFEKGESGPHKPSLKEGKTKPPSHYNESTLLSAMETCGKLAHEEELKEALKEKGIGTPATRASIIETLIKRKYIERHGKLLKATDSGRILISLVQEESLKSVELTGEWESRLKQIEKGIYSAVDFMHHIKSFTQKIIRNSDVTHIDYQLWGSCPLCKSPVIQGKKGFGCSKWKEGCHFVLWKQFENRELNEHEVRMLLQKHILFQKGAESVIILNKQGILTSISMPKPNVIFKRKTRKNNVLSKSK